MSGALPHGWIEVELIDHVYIAGRIGWRGLKAEEYTASGPILLSVPNLNHGNEVDFSKVNYISRARYDESPEIQLKVGDTLLVKDGAGIGKLGYVARLPGKATVNSSLLVVRPSDRLLSAKYLFYYLKGPQMQGIAIQRITGSATPHLFQKDIRHFRILVPPVQEQQRIVAKLDKLSETTDACLARLAKMSTLLGRFRQSVLSSAFSGRLTADWRRMHIKSESGIAFLPLLKQRLLAAARNEREAARVCRFFDPARLATAADEVGFDLPESWTACCIGTVGHVCNGSTPSRKEPAFWGGNIPWISSGEVRNNIISSTREQVSQAGFEGSSLRKLPPGTVLLAMIGEGKTRGQSAILQIEATINQNVAAVITGHGLVVPKFLWRWFQFQYQSTRERGGGSGPQALNCERVREIPFALPPPEEQEEIVRRLEALLQFADRVEARHAKAKERTNMLTMSILAKAFQGKLTEQNPSDDPASVLLECIREARLPQTQPRSKRKPASRRANSSFLQSEKTIV